MAKTLLMAMAIVGIPTVVSGQLLSLGHLKEGFLLDERSWRYFTSGIGLYDPDKQVFGITNLKLEVVLQKSSYFDTAPEPTVEFQLGIIVLKRSANFEGDYLKKKDLDKWIDKKQAVVHVIMTKSKQLWDDLWVPNDSGPFRFDETEWLMVRRQTKIIARKRISMKLGKLTAKPQTVQLDQFSSEIGAKGNLCYNTHAEDTNKDVWTIAITNFYLESKPKATVDLKLYVVIMTEIGVKTLVSGDKKKGKRIVLPTQQTRTSDAATQPAKDDSKATEMEKNAIYISVTGSNNPKDIFLPLNEDGKKSRDELGQFTRLYVVNFENGDILGKSKPFKMSF